MSEARHHAYLPCHNHRTPGLYSKVLMLGICHARGGPWAREQLINAKKEELISVMKEAGVEVEEGPMKLLGYYPPFAPRWIRLQEILLPVNKAPE